MDELPDTQTPDFVDSQKTQEIKTPWARLFSCRPDLDAVDLIGDRVLLGRSQHCDILICKSRFPQNYCLNISKEHFCITKDQQGPVCIMDLSKNGTYINGRLVGKGKRNILQNDDIISIGHKSIKAYIFKTIESGDDTYLPPVLRQKYFPSSLLGRGACGEVRLAFEKTTCETYAIKKIIKGRNSTSARQHLNHPSKIQTEVNILKRLSHPFIISMKEIVETEEAVFIVLEYMPGGELTGRILSLNSLTECQAKFLFYQILLGVKYLHSHGVTHRDLKPENVLLSSASPDAMVKITDFGLSKMMEEEDMMKTLCGTPHYVAPEVIDVRHNRYDQKVDVWSLGVILYYMLCQELPFTANDRAILNMQILRCATDWEKNWRHITHFAKDLVTRMLIVDPQQRISIDEIFKHSWISEDVAMQSRVDRLIKDSVSDEECQPQPAKKAKIQVEGVDSSSSGGGL